MDHNHNNPKEIHIFDLPNDMINKIWSELGLEDFKTLYLVCKKFQLLLHRDTPIVSQLETSNIKKLSRTSMFQAFILKFLTIKNHTTNRDITLESFISLETLIITDCFKANSPNKPNHYIILPPNLKIFKYISTSQPLQNQKYHQVKFKTLHCVSLQEIELNGTLNEEGGTLFILVCPFITRVKTISCSNAYIGFEIIDTMQEGPVNKPNRNSLTPFRFEEKHTIQLWVNNCVNSPIEFVESFYCSPPWVICLSPHKEIVTMNGLPAIYSLVVKLSEGKSMALTLVHHDTSIPSQTWRYTHGQIPQQLFDLSDLSDLFDPDNLIESLVA